MKLEYALMAMRDGEEIRRSSWEDDGCRLSIVDGKLFGTAYYNPATSTIEVREPGSFMKVEDILATDWEVVRRNSKVKTCGTCRHGRWFAEYSMQVCEKHGKSCPLAACEDYTRKGGEECHE